MKKLFILIAIFMAAKAQAQISNTFYGLARKNTPNNEIFLATINPSTGVVTNISPTSLSPIVNLTGAALDPYNNNYHFVGYNQMKTINLSTGLETNSVVINNPIANSYFDNFRFNHSDSTLYGLARRYIYDSVTMTGYGEVYLSTINTTTGTISQISPNSIGQGFALAGSAIDPYQKIFYYSTGTNLVGVDMYTGLVYSNPPITIQGGGTNFDNFTYSCADTALYGLIRTNYFSYEYDSLIMDTIQILDSTAIHLGRINPSTGVVSKISPTKLDQGGYTLNAGSTIDPSTMTYYYNNGYQLVGVSLLNGLKVSQQTINNTNGQFFELMRIQSNCYEAYKPIRQYVPTSVTSSLKQNNIIIFPNPTTGMIELKNSNAVVKIEIFDMVGKLLLTQKINSMNQKVDVSNLQTGNYLFKAYSKSNQFDVLKFVKE
jgi:hypothetical protein